MFSFVRPPILATVNAHCSLRRFEVNCVRPSSEDGQIGERRGEKTRILVSREIEDAFTSSII